MARSLVWIAKAGEAMATAEMATYAYDQIDQTRSPLDRARLADGPDGVDGAR